MIEDFNLKSKKSKSLFPKLLILVLIIAVLILTKATWNVYLKNRESGRNLNQARVDFKELKEREEDLNKEINKLSTERGIDEEIREKFRVTKEGEELIILVDLPEGSDEENKDDKKSLWQRFLDLF